MISAIVAVDENWGIGFNGELLEKIPEDMEYFKDLTIGNKDNVVVMGKKTFNSIQSYLPYRANIIISHSGFNGAKFDKREYMSNYNNGFPIVFTTLNAFKERIEFYKTSYTDIFIIGGGQIYKELLPFCDRVYVTKIFKSHNNVDTYFPMLEQKEWKITHQSEILTFNDLQYQFLTYDRIN